MGWAAGMAADGADGSDNRKAADEYGDGIERAVLVGADLRHPGRRGQTEQAARRRSAGATLAPEDSMEELEELARTAGALVVGRLMQKLDHPDPATFLGKGKVEELRDLVAEQRADLVIFDEELTPSQQRNLENALKTKIVDRTALILDIFAQRARTREGQLQVELAQLEYLLPRLKRMWSHLSRIRGGIGLRGPGETQLESDRRLVQHRIRDLKHKLG